MSLDLFHLADGADVAAGQLLDLGGLLAAHLVQTAQLFGVAGAGVDQGQVRGDLAGEDLDEGILAVLVGDGLEDVSRGHAAGGDDEFFRFAVLGGGLVVVALHGVGQQVHDVVHQHEGAHAVDGGAEEDGEHGQLPHALAQAADHLRVGEGLAAEILVHHLLGGLGDGLFQGLVELGDHIGLLGGDLDLDALVVLQLKGTLVQHVDEAGGVLILVPHGNGQGSDLVAIALAQGVEGRVVIAVLLVGLGDIDEPGHVALLAVFPDLFKANGNAVLGGADNDGGVGGPQGLHDLTGEVERTGGVQDVDLTALVFQGGYRGRNGDLAANFFGVIIADGVAIGAGTHALDCTGHKQQALSQGSLPAAAVAHQTDVSDVLHRITHSDVLSLFQMEQEVLISPRSMTESHTPSSCSQYTASLRQ